MTVADVFYDITETAEGWEVTAGGRGGNWKRMYPTAHAAQQAVLAAEEEQTAAEGRDRTAVINWTPVTAVGRAVVAAIT